MTQNLFVVAAVKVADAWDQEASLRKQRTPSDPAADAIASCASELREKMAEVDRATAYLTVPEFAKHRGMDQSTVRRLCARGELPGAERDLNNEWRIPRDAQRVQRRLQRTG